LTDHIRTTAAGRTIRIEGRLDQDDRARDPYVLIPFDVPSGARAIRVVFDHDPSGDADRPTEGAVLDLGLIGPGSTAIRTDAFRGWSGSERSVVTVGETRATPGYRPGSITADRWHAVLGLYAIPPAGCRFSLDIESLDREPFETIGVIEEPTTAAPPRTAPAPIPAPRWFACDLHAHSVHSDGVDELADLAAAARRSGLDVVFVTDHNTTSHHAFLDTAPNGVSAMLPGEEVTTYRGHMNALGATGWIDFRHRTVDGVTAAIDTIHGLGGLASINHPRRNDCAWDWGDVPMDLVEVWNGPWSDANEGNLAWWYELVGGDGRPSPVGGSDCHAASDATHPLGSPATWVHATAPTREAILGGLAAGRVAVTASSSERPPAIVRDEIGIAWDLPADADRRLVIRSTQGVVVERSLAAGSRDALPVGHPGSPPIPLAAEIRGPADELIALTPLLTTGG
jgi:predicted metal-dependent phosphoesterase TrpH